MKRIEIKKIFENLGEYTNKEVVVCGWIRTIRDSKTIGFIELNDGSNFKSAQIVIEDNIENFKDIIKCNVGASLIVTGTVVETPEMKQPFEIKVSKIDVSGHSSPEYPLQTKRHSLEFLREIAHLRAKTNTFSAVFRVRSVMSYAIHRFFNERGFVYIHVPIITSSDCEGAGEMFRVTTMDLNNIPKNEKNDIDFTKDFFQKSAGLTVSGQLAGECFAMAFGNIYTFGPTFRAENSNTTRHAAEFWMIEPEMAFADLNDDMEIAEAMLKYIIQTVLNDCKEEIKFLNEFYDKNLIERLNSIVNCDFERLTYTKAIEILEKYNDKFQYKVSWGVDLQTEHERFITEEIYKKPVFLTDYPKEIKAFYMKLNDDNKTVAAMDLLVPGIGEIMGGSQREENLEKLEKRMQELNLNKEDYSWYLDTRRFGTVEHSGFGLGFERAIMYLTGISNIRDVSPFPRTPGNINF